MDHSNHHPKESINGHSLHTESAHDKHAGHHVADFWKRFVICSIVSIPVLAFSHMVQQGLGFELTFKGDNYVLSILSTFIFFYGGYPFLKGLYNEVKDNAIGMMTLIGVAISVAWSYSVAITLGLQGMDFYWEMATLIDILSVIF